MSSFDDETSRLMRRAGERARAVPGLLGHALRVYAESEEASDVAAVVGWLRGGIVGEDEVAKVCVCRRPAVAEARETAEALEFETAKLVRVLRRVEVAEATARGGASSVAARREGDDA
jgi:hypothetical protein